jgi:hypothetical protein
VQREVVAREFYGGEGRIGAAPVLGPQSLEEFDFDHARGLKHDVIAHLGTLDFTTARDNVCSSGRPAPGRTPSRRRLARHNQVWQHKYQESSAVAKVGARARLWAHLVLDHCSAKDSAWMMFKSRTGGT